MRSNVKTLMACLFILSLALFLSGCGSSSSDGGESCTSFADFSGSWIITSGTNNATDCGEGIQDLQGQTFSIAQSAGSSTAFVTIDGNIYQGKVCNNKVTGSATYQDGSGETTESLTATISGGTISASSNWTYTEVGWGSCSGTATFTAIKQ